MDPKEAPAQWSFDLTPVPYARSARLGGSTGDHDTARFEDRRGHLVERRRIARTAHHDCVVAAGARTSNRLEPAVEHLAPTQSELAHDGGEKRDTLHARLQQRERCVGEDDLEWDAGDAGPGSDVQDSPYGRREQLHEEQAIEKDVIDDPARIRRPHEALALLPFQQQFQVFLKLVGFGIREGPAQDRRDAHPERVRRERRSWPHVRRRPAPWGGSSTTAARSAGRWTRSSTARARTAGSGT